MCRCRGHPGRMQWLLVTHGGSTRPARSAGRTGAPGSPRLPGTPRTPWFAGRKGRRRPCWVTGCTRFCGSSGRGRASRPHRRDGSNRAHRGHRTSWSDRTDGTDRPGRGDRTDGIGRRQRRPGPARRSGTDRGPWPALRRARHSRHPRHGLRRDRADGRHPPRDRDQQHVHGSLEKHRLLCGSGSARAHGCARRSGGSSFPEAASPRSAPGSPRPRGAARPRSAAPSRRPPALRGSPPSTP